MEEIKAYKCGYCGKLYQRKHACRRHEDNDCLKNPKIRPVCFDCKLMQRSEETEDGLDDEGWEAMPTHAEGCKYAKLYRDDYGNSNKTRT